MIRSTRSWTTLRRRLAQLLFAAALLFSVCGTVSAQPQWTQTFPLQAGWNAIYLTVQPAVIHPEDVFAGVQVRSVWTRGTEPGAIQFACVGETPPCVPDPVTALRSQRGWLAYEPPSGSDPDAGKGPELANNRLVGVFANRAYLIDAKEAGTLTITGRPLVPQINWQANSYNLVGFAIDPNASESVRSVANFLKSSPALNNQRVYKLLSTGIWERVVGSAPLEYGKAYWVYAATGTDFVAPLSVQLPSLRGLDYGATVDDYQLVFRNLANVATNISVRDLGKPDTVPLTYFNVVTDGPDKGDFQWLDLSAMPPLNARANGYQAARLAVRRDAFSADSMSTVLAVTDEAGSRWLVPVEARRLATRGAGGGGANGDDAATPCSMAGLWVGTAVVNKVSEPQRGETVPRSTFGAKNTCTGGPRLGLDCTRETAAEKCPGLCGAPPNRCAGGPNDGLECGPSIRFCPGGECTEKQCAGGDRKDQPCVVDDCPGSLCAARCNGGANDGNPCGARLCEGGLRSGGVCSANDCPDGACELREHCSGSMNPCGRSCPTGQQCICPEGSRCVEEPFCKGGTNNGLACSKHDCPDGHCRDDCPGGGCNAAAARCIDGVNKDRSCQRQDCPNSTCSAPGTRCIGGSKDNQACNSPTDCSFRCDENGGGSEFPLRLMIHVDGNGQARLLKQVYQLFKEGSTKPSATDPSYQTDDVPGNYVLYTKDELIPNIATVSAKPTPGALTGATLIDGVPSGRRLSTPHFDFPGTELPFDAGGSFGKGGILKTSIVLPPDLPTHPFRHKFHPEHDNRYDGVGATPGPGDPKQEVFTLTRRIELEFAASDPRDKANKDYGCRTIAGTYKESIAGLHKRTIYVEGTLQLDHVTSTKELNK